MARPAPHFHPSLLAAWSSALILALAIPARAQVGVPGNFGVPAPDQPAQDTAGIAAPARDTAAKAAPAVAADTAAKPLPPAPIPAPAETMVSEGPADDGLTIEVDKKQSSNQDKSLPLALLLSAALPGTGEYYLQEKSRAKVFLLVETGFWASLYVAYLAKQSYLQSARNYATEFAGIDASGKSAAFLETMANYRAYQEKQHRQDSYELAQILSGKREQDYDIAPKPENYWDFGSSNTPANTENWKTFQSTLRYYRASKVAMSFAIGALALNRLASLVNTLNVYKRTSAKSYGFNVTPDLGPEYAGALLTLRF